MFNLIGVELLLVELDGAGEGLLEDTDEGVLVGELVTIVIPLSQTILFPDFIAVYLRPRQIIVCPTFFGTRVGLAAIENFGKKESSAPSKTPRRATFFML